MIPLIIFAFGEFSPDWGIPKNHRCKLCPKLWECIFFEVEIGGRKNEQGNQLVVHIKKGKIKRLP